MRRIMSASMVGLAMLLLLASPAHAAENLACASALVDDKSSDEIFTAYRKGADLGEALNERIGRKLAACLLNHDWSEDATESAMRVLFGEILERGFVKELAAYKGLSTDALRASIDGFFARMSAEDVRKFADGDMSDEAAALYVQQLLEDGAVTGEQLEKAAFGRLIGELVSSRANQTVFRAAFERQ